MSWAVLVRPEAERDVVEAHDWYEQKSLGLGDEFVDELAATIRALELNPERERLYYRNFRRIMLRRFPYKVFYQIVGARVVVFRVLHAKQSHERRMYQG